MSQDIIQKLADRKAKILTRFQSGAGNSAEEIGRLLEALDHLYSHYAVLTQDQRAQVRAEWLALAAQLGVRLKPATDQPAPQKKARKAPPVPLAVAAFFGAAASCVPFRPRACDDYESGTYPCSWLSAATLMTVQLNPPNMTHWLVFDCDHTDTERWRASGLPEPSFTTVNPANGHHHVVFKLTAPVCTSERAREAPQRYLRAVREALRVALAADSGYANLLTKNPLHPSWTVIRPTGELRAYTLAQLATGLTLEGPAGSEHAGRGAKLGEVTEGRNVALFDSVRTWAYAHSTGAASVLTCARRLNSSFDRPLADSEVRGIAASISRFCEGNRFSNNIQKFKKKQAARGRLGGRPQTTGGSKPWLAEGVSRATWYRRHQSSQTARETP